MSRQRSRRDKIRREIESAIEEGRLNAIIDQRVQRKPWTYVKVVFCRDWEKASEFFVEGHGFSKVCYPDVFDAEYGIGIATRRAIKDAAQKLMEMEDRRTEEEIVGEMEFVAPLMVPVGDVQTVG